jgi:hypothetical protein
MNVEKTSSATIQMRQDASTAQKNKADQAKQNEQKQALEAAAAQEAKKTREEKQGSTLKGGEINLTA